MIAGQLALITAALFTGAAIYVSAVENPARMALEPRAMLTEWKPAYKRGFAMQASLALIGFVLGAWSYRESSNWLWLAGALTLLANWPYTLLVILPTNNKLLATPIEAANADTRALILKWAQLHAARRPWGSPAPYFFCWPRSESGWPGAPVKAALAG